MHTERRVANAQRFVWVSLLKVKVGIITLSRVLDQVVES